MDTDSNSKFKDKNEEEIQPSTTRKRENKTEFDTDIPSNLSNQFTIKIRKKMNNKKMKI